MQFPADIKHKTNSCDIYNGSPLTVSRLSHHPLAVCNLITPSPARSAPEH